MKGLRSGALPWHRMTKKQAATQIENETPEDCYDYDKAIEVKTIKTKPRIIGLTNFSKAKSRDEMLLNSNDAFANVILENTREERAEELRSKK